MPLAGATVFDSRGNVVGICSDRGRMPRVSGAAYPITLRCLGYGERVVESAVADTIFLDEVTTELAEVVVESRERKVMHMLAYVREYSTLTSYTDTVFLFREKMVDYMLTPDSKMKFKGWSRPRTIKSRSYYRFSNLAGLDSVSDRSNYHFSWSDWVGVVAPARLPDGLRGFDTGSDTVRGRYSAAEVWSRSGYRLSVDVDVLADTASRRWVPGMASFFGDDLDFGNFHARFNYDNVIGDSVSAADLTGYSFNIESTGRGHNMFMFNRADQPFFVNTYAEVYILDKEFITVKEARKWERRKINLDAIEIFEPPEAPPLQPAVMALVERVSMIDADGVRLSLDPDQRLVALHSGDRNFSIGRRALALLKQLTGISRIIANRNINRRWEEFKQSWRER